MSHRLKVIFVALAILTAGYLLLFLLAGWPNRPLNEAFASNVEKAVIGSFLEAMVLFIIAIVLMTGKGGAAPGTIGTEKPVELPPGFMTRREKGGSYLLAAGLVLLIGGSVCWGYFFTFV